MTNEILEVADLIPPTTQPFAEEVVPRVAIASQWTLMWWKFRKHRLAMIALVIIVILYIVAIFAGFFAPQAPDQLQRAPIRRSRRRRSYWFDNGTFAPFHLRI